MRTRRVSGRRERSLLELRAVTRSDGVRDVESIRDRVIACDNFRGVHATGKPNKTRLSLGNKTPEKIQNKKKKPGEREGRVLVVTIPDLVT